MGDEDKLRKLWLEKARKWYWGDNLDSRFLVVEYIKNIKNKKVLDLGCNAGVLHTFIHPSNVLLGIDLDSEAIRVAKELNKDKKNFSYVVGDIRDESLYPGKYDVIIFLAMLELFHPEGDYKLGDPVEMMKKLKRHLSEDGFIILTTPNANNPYHRKNKKWKLEEVEEIISRAGLRVEERILWNPVSIRLSKLYFLPYMFKALKFLSKTMNSPNSVSCFYILKHPKD